ncbi:MAG: PP2C family protein-serine/threonine phosphatase [Terracidiphilus sp.]|nr:PP2C family protein-serine/threonine phosphatase [Terracidiphilus sp.]
MRSRTFLAFGFLLLAAVCTACLQAQPAAPDPRHVDATQFGALVQLGPNWLFAPGDNPAWASPTFDDSAWKTISAEEQLTQYGYRNLSYAWYRIHVHLRPGTRNLAVGVAGVNGSYEVYANGARVGANGQMRNRFRAGHNILLAFPVPDSAITPAGDLVLAIRCAVNTLSSNGSGASRPLASDSIFLISQESAPLLASYVVAHQAGPALLLCGFALVVALVSFALFLALRTQFEYLAISIYLFAASAVLAALVRVYFKSSLPVYALMWVGLCLENFALIEVVRLVLHLPRKRWLLMLQVISSLAFFVPLLNSLGIGSPALQIVGFYLPVLTVKVLLPLLLLRGWFQGNRDAGVLLPAILIGSLADYWKFVCDLISWTHFTSLYPLVVFSISIGSYDVDFYRIGDCIFYIALLLFLVLRTLAIARDRARVAAELEAARTVQQVLIPEDIPTIPGFVLHSVYKPAGQVGGDFFQIVAVKGGGVLAVIGDVSGKGMPAAMTVSLLVGTVRTLAHYTQSPGEILAAMNQRMLARSSGGFTTCLVLRADADGKLTIANAGHIAPYLSGKELPLENGLPLGIAADSTYPESAFRLVPGEQLTLLTDGVVEARDKAGALFGFERAAAISGKSADQIAKTAELFGQDDDITALTLARTA